MIILEFILLSIIFVILIATCGIAAVISKIKSEFRLYKYHILRGAIIASILFIFSIIVSQISYQSGLMNKILGSIIFTLIGILPAIFHGVVIGGFVGYLFGKLFGRAGRC